MKLMVSNTNSHNLLLKNPRQYIKHMIKFLQKILKKLGKILSIKFLKELKLKNLLKQII